MFKFKVTRHARIQKVLSDEVQRLQSCFSLMRGGLIQIQQLADHHRPTSKKPFKWCFAGGSMMAQHRMLAWYLGDFSENRDQFWEENPICL